MSGKKCAGAPGPGASGDEETKRKIGVIRREIRKELDLGFKFADREIEQLHSGLTGAIVTPFVKFAYRFGARDQIRARGLKQLDVMLECAEKFDGSNLEAILEEHFDDYLFYDETYMRSRLAHPKAKQLRILLWNICKSRTSVIARIMQGNGRTYDELVRSIWERDEAELVMGKDFEYVDRMMALVEKERGLLDIPSIARSDVIRMLHISYTYAKKRLNERIEEIYRHR